MSICPAGFVSSENFPAGGISGSFFVYEKNFVRIKYQFPFNFVLYKIRITSDLEKGTNYILNATVGDLCLSLRASVRERMTESTFLKKE